jgi:hypothetical protein
MEAHTQNYVNSKRTYYGSSGNHSLREVAIRQALKGRHLVFSDLDVARV